jgi:hypothetical protein
MSGDGDGLPVLRRRDTHELVRLSLKSLKWYLLGHQVMGVFFAGVYGARIGGLSLHMQHTYLLQIPERHFCSLFSCTTCLSGLGLDETIEKSDSTSTLLQIVQRWRCGV